jgi:hypothetical protein
MLIFLSDCKEWINIAKISGYNQLIYSSTRVTDNTTSLIDHIYVSLIDNILSFGNLDIPLSDHKLIFVSRKLNFQSRKNNIDNKFIVTRFWKDFKWERLLEIVNKVDFPRLYSSKDFNPKKFCEKLTEKLCIARNSIILPKKFMPRIRSSTPWINAEVKALIRKRNFYFNKYKKSLNACLPYEDYYNIYIFYRNKSVNSIKYYKRNYFKKLIENNKNSSRNLWRILTSVLKFDFTFSTKESETEIDIENINEFCF